MDSPLPGILAVLVTIFIIGFLVLIHEFGHFLAARAVGVRVEKFSIGFGPVLWKRKFGATEFSLKLIMFGGYVQMFGDLDASSTRQDESLRQHPESYLSKTPAQKFLISIAGVLVNFLFGIVAFALFLGLVGNVVAVQKIGNYKFLGAQEYQNAIILTDAFGVPQEQTGIILSLDGQIPSDRADLLRILQSGFNRDFEIEIYRNNKVIKERLILNGEGVKSNLDLDFFPNAFNTKDWGNNLGRLLITNVAADSPLLTAKVVTNTNADSSSEKLAAELFVEHYLLNIEGAEIWNSKQLAGILEARLGETIKLTFVDNNGIPGLYEVQLPAAKDPEKGILQVEYAVTNAGFSDKIKIIRYDSAITGGVLHAMNSVAYNAYGLGVLVREAVQGKPDNLVQNVGSVVAVGSQVSGVISESLTFGAENLVQLLNLLAALSVILAFMNILPIPILDGGNLVFIILEAIRKKPISVKVMNILYTVFFVLLVGLMVVMVGLDIWKLVK